MLLERLTERAKKVLLILPKSDSVTANQVIRSVSLVGGVGSSVLKAIPSLRIKKNKKVEISKLVTEAYLQSSRLEHFYVGTEHIVLALLKITDSEDYEFYKVELLKLNLFPGTLNKETIGGNFGVLQTIGVNLNQMYIKNTEEPLVDREEYSQLVSSLLLKNSPNVLLIGDPGVGKKTLLKILARNIVNMKVPPILAGYQVMSLDIMSLMTALMNKGNVDQALSGFIDEIKSTKRLILHLDNFQSLFYATPAGVSLPIFYNLFISALNNEGMKAVAAMDASLFNKILVDNAHLLEDFSIVNIEEPSKEKTMEILKANSSFLSLKHNVEIPDGLLETVYEKSRDTGRSDKYPEKAIDLLDQACSVAVLGKSKIPDSYTKLVDKSFDLLNEMEDFLDKGDYVSASAIKTRVETYDKKLSSIEDATFINSPKIIVTQKDIDKATGYFLGDMMDEEKELKIAQIPDLHKKIKASIVGQDHAVDLVTKSIIRSSLGLRAKKRPLGNFLFLGPTGVGKTEFAKVLSREFFGEDSLIRLDMSDFAEKHNVARLVGAPPGYVGYGEGGELTTKIETNPDSVVLFDEIEKAHPDVLNILLQIMDEGELTDAKGQSYDFSKSVVILTSNLGTKMVDSDEIGFTQSESSDKKVEDRLIANLKKILKPELLNRFDEVIVFKSLSKESQERILNLLVKEILDTLKRQDVELKVGPSIKKYLLKSGYSKEYGARGLRRTLERELLDKIAEYLLVHEKRPLSLNANYKAGQVVISNGVSKSKK